jgi:MFS transporter, DHA1 family, multidrug resistance protein
MLKLREIVKGNLGVMMVSSGIWTFAGQLVTPFQSLYIIHLGGSYFHIGLIASIASISAIIPTLLGGQLADTYGRKKMLYSMSFILSLNSLVFSFARNVQWLIVASILNSLAGGFRQPAFSSIIDDSTDVENRAQSYAFWSIVPPLFGLASPYFMGMYMDKRGVVEAIRVGYVILFAASFIASFLRYLYIEETLKGEKAYKLSLNGLASQTVNGASETVRTLSRPLKILGLMGLFFGFGAAVGSPFWVVYATEDIIKLSLSEWGFITAANTLVGAVISIPLAMVADRYGKLCLLIPAIFITPLAILGFTLSRSFFEVFIVTVIVTLLGSVGMSSGQALFTDLTEPHHRGRVNALWSIAGTMRSFQVGVAPGSLMGAFGGLLGGYLYENVGGPAPLYIQSIMVGLTAMAGVFLVRETGKICTINYSESYPS